MEENGSYDPETIIDAVVMEQNSGNVSLNGRVVNHLHRPRSCRTRRNKLLMRNRCHLTRFQLLFPPLYFFIRNVHAGRRQRIEKSRGQ